MTGTIVTPLMLKTRYPEFTMTADSVIQMALDESALFMSEKQWGSKYTLGMIHKTAHTLVSAYKGALDGLTELTEDMKDAPQGTVLRSQSFELAREWSHNNLYTNHEESSTNYGIRYLALRSTIFFARTCL